MSKGPNLILINGKNLSLPDNIYPNSLERIVLIMSNKKNHAKILEL